MRFTIATAAILAQSVPATTTSEIDSPTLERVFGEETLSLVSDIQGTATLIGTQRSNKFLNLVKAKKETSGGYLKNTQNSNSKSPKDFQECDPESDEPDVGVLSCGAGRYCVESDESKIGGFCVSSPDELDRALQGGDTLLDGVYTVFCPDDSLYGDQCNCTNYDPEAYTLDVM
jgi:hypothetical protein